MPLRSSGLLEMNGRRLLLDTNANVVDEVETLSFENGDDINEE
jgi:hypothetical protein